MTVPTTALPYDPRRYWNDRVAGDGLLANVGQVALGEYNRFTYPLRLEALDRALADRPVAGLRVFDAGFGEGVYLAHWRSHGARAVAGLELSVRAVRAGRRRFPDFDLQCGDLSVPGAFAGFGIYDLVTALDVLYHVVDDDAWSRAVANLLALVAPGGRFLFSDKFPRAGRHQLAPHVRRRALAVWEEALARHAFAVVRRVPVFVLMDDPITVGAHPWLGRVARLQWRVGARLVRGSRGRFRLHRTVATAVASAQLPLERLLVRLLREAPNLEIAVCRRSEP